MLCYTFKTFEYFITLFTLVLLRHLRGVIVVFLITLFYPLSFCDKKGE
jgi:hypothetical protein